MKKLLASALLTGLLLGAATPVLAADIDSKEFEPGISPTGTTPIESTIAANYIVEIPSTLSIDLMNGNQKSTVSNVTLTSLTAAGSITVKVDTSDQLTLSGVTVPEDNEVIPTILTNSNDSSPLTSFELTNINTPQTIQIETSELSTDNVAGTYKGSLVFTFDYLNPSDEASGI